MEAILNDLQREYPNSIASHRILLNAAGTAAIPGHRGVGTAVTFKARDALARHLPSNAEH